MKNIILVFFFLLIGFRTIAQETIDVDDIKVHSFVQRKAEPKEGLQHFYKNYMRKFNSAKFSSPTGALDVRLKFIVEKDGAFSDIQVLNESVQGLGEEAIRVLKTMPAWKPATHNGKIVRSAFTLPMKMFVNEEDDKTEDIDELEEADTIITTSIVETEYFKFDCNQCSVRDTGLATADYRIKNKDKTVDFQVTIMEMPKELADEMISMLDNNVKDPNTTFKDIIFLGITMKQVGFYDEFLGHIQMVSFYKNGYLVNIGTSSLKPELTLKFMKELKQTFKLKL